MNFNVFPRRSLITRKTQWYFNMEADNHELIAHSEGYNNLTDALHTVDLIKTDAADAAVEVHKS